MMVTRKPKPWEAAKRLAQSADHIDPPQAIRISPDSHTLRVSWRRKVGRKVDGFKVLLGTDPSQLTEQQVERQRGKQIDYDIVVGPLDNECVYYVTLVAFREDRQSEIQELWKVTPNVPGRVRPAEKVDLSLLATEQIPRVTEAEREILSGDTTQTEPGIVSQETTQVTQVHEQIQPSVSEPTAQSRVALCPSCAGDIVLDVAHHVFQCTGCQKQYVKRVVDDALVPVDILLNGICECCEPRRPLVKPPGVTHPTCPVTNEAYVEIAGGRRVRVSELDYGLCECCRPPHPLILNQQGQVVCSAHRDHLYVQNGSGWHYQPPQQEASLLDDIDAALSDGSANMLPGGILTSGNGNN